MHYTYILQSKKDSTYYIGSTSDLRKRVKAHNHKVGSSYTAKKGPFDLVWYGSFKTKILAQRFEMYLKSSSGFAFRNKRLI